MGIRSSPTSHRSLTKNDSDIRVRVKQRSVRSVKVTKISELKYLQSLLFKALYESLILGL